MYKDNMEVNGHALADYYAKQPAFTKIMILSKPPKDKSLEGVTIKYYLALDFEKEDRKKKKNPAVPFTQIILAAW